MNRWIPKETLKTGTTQAVELFSKLSKYYTLQQAIQILRQLVMVKHASRETRNNGKQ